MRWQFILYAILGRQQWAPGDYLIGPEVGQKRGDKNGFGCPGSSLCTVEYTIATVNCDGFIIIALTNWMRIGCSVYLLLHTCGAINKHYIYFYLRRTPGL